MVPSGKSNSRPNSDKTADPSSRTVLIIKAENAGSDPHER